MTAPRHQPRRALLLAAAAVAGLLAHASVLAQQQPFAPIQQAAPAAAQTPPPAPQGEPIVFGQREENELILLHPWQVWTEVQYRYQYDQTKPRGGEPITFREDRIQETISLANSGAIVHPNLLEFNIAGTFGLTQDWIDNDGQKDYRNGIVYDYDVSATLLRKEDAPLTVYSRRSEDLVNRQFGPTLDNILWSNGAIWDIRSKTIPTRFEVFYSEQEQNGIASDIEGNTGDFSLDQTGFLWHSEAHPSDRHSINWDYSYTHNNEATTGFPSNTFDVHDATLSDSIDFGDKRQHNLSSSINYFNQNGDFPIERLLWTQLLRLKHTETFETRYQYTLQKQDFSDIDQLQNRGTAGFTHRLYKSLITTGEVGVQQIDRSDNANSFEYFGDINWDYTKKVPLGTFNGLLGLAWDRTHNDAQSEVTQIIDDARTFVDAQPIIIAGRGIIPSTLRVTDASGVILYQQGLDYLILSNPQFLQISRIVGGRIDPGQTVLLDYQLQPAPANTVTTGDFTLGGRYTIEEGPLRGISIYGRYARQNQNIDAESPSEFVENSFNDLLYGAEYDFLNNQAAVGIERQNHDATIAPFDATRYFARYTSRFARETTFTLSLTFDQIDYHDPENHVDSFVTSAVLRHQFSQQLRGFVSVLFQNQDDELFGNSTGMQEQIELQWTHRQTTVYVLFRNATLDSDVQDNTFQFLEVGIRRDF